MKQYSSDTSSMDIDAMFANPIPLEEETDDDILDKQASSANPALARLVEDV